MKVCIFGAGAIGGYLGAQMARAGHDVSLVARGPHLAAMREHGLRLQIEGRELVERIACSDDSSRFGPQEFVIIALKAHSIPAAVPSMLPLLDDATTLVTASNGLPYWYFGVPGVPFQGLTLQSVDAGGVQRTALGLARAVGCVVYPATEIIAPGVIRHEHGGKFPIGEPDGSTTARIERLRTLFTSSGFDAPIRNDIRDEIWLKLWGNLGFNPVSALTRATIDVVVTDPGTRRVLLAMMEEARAIGERLGLRLRVSAERRLAGAQALGPHKMSMLQDLECGRTMEVEALVGVIRELGTVTGVPVPNVDIVHALVSLLARTSAAS
jgi:2-dehydropantoate 2-reductase